MKYAKNLIGCATAALLLAGCGTAAHEAGPASPSESATTAGPAATTGAPTAGGTLVTACTSAGLRLTQLPQTNGAAGTIVVAIQLRNPTGRPCTVAGYPSFTLGLRTGNSAKVAVTPGHLGGLPAFAASPATVSVPAAGTAGFLVAYSNVPMGSKGACDSATTMHLTLPAEGPALTGPVHLAVCGEPMQVSPYVPAAKLALG